MIRLSRLSLVCALLLISCSSTKAADSKLDKLDPNDRGVLQKLLDIDPQLEWMSNCDRLSYLGFSSHGATTGAIALLPQLTSLSIVHIHKDVNHRLHGWQPGEMAPLSRCPKLRVLGVVIAEEHTPAIWESLPVLPQIRELKIFDQAVRRVTISDRCPNATGIILWSRDLTQFDAGQFGNHPRLRQRGQTPVGYAFSITGTNTAACVSLPFVSEGGATRRRIDSGDVDFGYAECITYCLLPSFSSLLSDVFA